MTPRCIICRKELPEDQESPICFREYCKLTQETRVSLKERMDFFKAFWTEKIPSESNYKEYFELSDKEKSYQQFAVELLNKGEKVVSRRSFFWANIGSVHVGWPTEFAYLKDKKDELTTTTIPT